MACKKSSKKKRSKRKHRYKIKVTTVDRCSWIVGVIDTKWKKKPLIRIDSEEALPVFQAWLREHRQKYSFTYGPWSQDEDNDPTEVLVQIK